MHIKSDPKLFKFFKIKVIKYLVHGCMLQFIGKKRLDESLKPKFVE